MSVRFMDDPIFYGSSQLTLRYGLASGSVSSSGGRFGGPCFQFVGGFAAQFNRATVPGTPLVTGTVAVSIKLGGFGSAGGGTAVATLFDSASTQVVLALSASGNLFVVRGGIGGTQIGPTSGNALLTGVWYRIEFKATIDPSNGAVEVRVDGTSTGWIPPTSSLNTRSTANSSFNQVSIGPIDNTGGSANDLVVTDTTAPNANFLGDKKIYRLTPNSDSSVQWTPTFASFQTSHAYAVGETFKDSNNNVQRCTVPGTSAGSAPTWATTGGSTTTSGGATFVVLGSGSNPGAHNWMAVSEVPVDGDSSYNTSATPNDVDLFGVTSLPGTATNVAAVDVIGFSRKDDAGTRTEQTLLKSGATQVSGPTVGLSTSYLFTDFVNETDPNTSAAWTNAAVNAALIGYKEVS